MDLSHLDPVSAASLVAAGALALTRLLTTAKPLWDRLPASLQGLLPVLVLVLPQIAASAAGVHTSLDFINLLVLAIALILPGVHSHTVALTKPSGPSSALLVLVFMLSFGAGLACATGSTVAWPKVLSCAEPLEQPLVESVAKVLTGDGDVKTELEALAGQYAPGVIECAVQQLVGDLASGPTTARASHAAKRGRSFLNAVQQ
jgi:hypothetical protein